MRVLQLHGSTEIGDHQLLTSLGAGDIKWKGESVQDLEFLGSGKAKRAWKELKTDQLGGLVWNRIGRAKMTAAGWEWLLVKAYSSKGELVGEPHLRAVSEAIVETVAADFPQFPTLDDVGVRLATMRFLRSNGVCCRLLLILEASDNFPESCCGSVAQGILDHCSAIPAIRNRVFVALRTGKA